MASAKWSGDHYCGEWSASAFAENGITYEASERNKSEIYLEALPLFSRGVISIPNLPPLIGELAIAGEADAQRRSRHCRSSPTWGSTGRTVCAAALR